MSRTDLPMRALCMYGSLYYTVLAIDHLSVMVVASLAQYSLRSAPVFTVQSKRSIASRKSTAARVSVR